MGISASQISIDHLRDLLRERRSARLIAAGDQRRHDARRDFKTAMLDVSEPDEFEKGSHHVLLPGRCCVLVTSSDRARDIFEIVFQNAEIDLARLRLAAICRLHEQAPEPLRL